MFRRSILNELERWSDKEGRNIVVKRQVNGELISIPPNDKRYALPLPADIVAITGMTQNPW